MSPRVRFAVLSVAASAALALTGCTAAGSEAEASCAAPQLSLPDTEVEAGQQVSVAGRDLFDGCYDTGQQGDPPPATDVELTLSQGGRTYALGSEDAAADGTARWTVTLPDDLRDGPARLSAGASETLRVQVAGRSAADLDGSGDDVIDGFSSASCAAPSLIAPAGQLAPGEAVTVRGRDFRDGCNDTGQDTATPARTDITLSLKQGRDTYELATADADGDGQVVFEVTIPESVGAGSAELFTDRIARVPVEIGG